MTTSAQVRQTALSLPETGEEDTGTGTTAFTVDGEPFAATTENNEAHLQLPRAEAEEFLAAHPAARRVPAGVRVPLEDIDGQALNHWVRRAWLSRAPGRLTAQAAADTATPGGVGDLPKGIGRPATRALAAAGITTLAQVAELTEDQLRALHGVGPKAMAVLREALGADGRSFRQAP